MASYRHGQKDGFFDGVTTFNQSTNPGGGVSVSSGNYSNAVQIGREASNFTFFVTASGTSQWTLQVAPIGDQSGEGIFPDEDSQTYTWCNLYMFGTAGTGMSTPVYIGITGAQSVAALVPGWEPNWVRLLCTAGTAVTVTAGWEIQGSS